jgi:TonB family protein
MRQRSEEAAEVVYRVARTRQAAGGQLTVVSASELGRQEFALHWHEAVAVVAETAAMLLARGLTTVPETSSVILAPDGTLHLLNEGPPGAAPAPRLGGMLDALLSSTPCPPELRKLTDESMADPPAYATIEAFANALAFFERPGRHELLAAVGARSSEVQLEARANTELEHLEARARNVPRTAERVPEQTPSHRTRNRVVLLVAGSVLLLGIVAGALVGLRATGSSSATITERVRARVDRIAQRGLEAVGLRTPDPPSSTPTAAVIAPKRVAPKTSRRAPRQLPVTISVKELAGASLSTPPSAVAPESPEPIVRDEVVYTAEAEGVEPAVLMRPHLPSRPPAEATSEEIGILEVIVSATGAVEQVRLISATNRYHDRMIVAAAKAWQFEPATKDGQPVRYRTRIRITL